MRRKTEVEREDPRTEGFGVSPMTRSAPDEKIEVSTMAGKLQIQEIPICVEVRRSEMGFRPVLKSNIFVELYPVDTGSIPVEQYAEMEAEQLKQNFKEKLIEKMNEAKQENNA